MRRVLLALLLAVAPCAASADMFSNTPPPTVYRDGAWEAGNCVQQNTATGHFVTTGAPCGAGGGPTGAASGDLGGTYPAPTVVDISHVSAGTLGVARGGTGGTTAATARTGLGVVIGTNVEAWSAVLDAIAAGAMNSVTVGASTPASGAFTTLGATGSVLFSGLSSGTQVSCMGLDSGNHLVLALAACGSGGGGGTPANPTATASDTANNGVASTYMRSDASPAVQKATNAQFGLMEGDAVGITCVAGVCSTTYTVDTTQTAGFSVGASQMNKFTPVNISGGGTITLPSSGAFSTFFASGQTWCAENRGATADTITNSTGGTMYPTIATLQPGDTICFVSDGSALYANVAPGTYSGTGSVARTASPAFTGTPTAPTAAVATNTTQLATTAFVQAQTVLAALPVSWDSNTTVANATIPLTNPQWAGGGTITSVTFYTGTGSFTANVKIGGTSATGCSALAVSSSSPTTTTCTAANTFTNSSQLTLVISGAASTPNTALVQINMTHTIN